MYDGMKHYCLEGTHIVNLFSFSKAYGMMGWRVGYVSASHSSFMISLCFTTPGALVPTPALLATRLFLAAAAAANCHCTS
jgi:aspartate/methionine/tyrosine aminotransferase